MHEYAIAKGIVDVVLATLGNRECVVKKVWVKAGVTKAIVEDALRFSFDVLKKQDKRLAGAELMYQVILLRGRCRNCRAEFEIDRISGLCPVCGSADVEWLAGDELFVEKIEISDGNRESDGRDVS